MLGDFKSFKVSTAKLFLAFLLLLEASYASVSLASQPSQMSPGDSLASKRTAKALLGIFLNDNSTLIAGAATTIPMTQKIALDGGVDYVKWGSELLSATFLRIAAGAGYAAYSGPDSLIRLGGRIGVGKISTSLTIPPLLGIGKGYKADTKKTGLYGELRAAYEKEFDGLTLGGEIQIPVYFSESTSDSTSISAYGTLGFVF
ncbi:MAG: hypothetical protein WCL28_00240 [bacterium]